MNISNNDLVFIIGELTVENKVLMANLEQAVGQQKEMIANIDRLTVQVKELEAELAVSNQVESLPYDVEVSGELPLPNVTTTMAETKENAHPLAEANGRLEENV